MRGKISLLFMLPAILFFAGLAADDPFIRRQEAVTRGLADFKLQGQPTGQPQSGSVITLPPISIGAGGFGFHRHRRGPIFFFGIHGPNRRYRYPYYYYGYGYPYYPYYPYYNPYNAGYNGYAAPYAGQQPASIANTIYNAPGPTYSEQPPSNAQQEKEADRNTERIDNYISNLADEDPAVRKIAVIVLAELKAKEAEGLLIDLVVNDNDAGVRLAAAEALGEIGSVKAVEPLYKAKKDEDKRVRLAAVKSLRKLRKLWTKKG